VSPIQKLLSGKNEFVSAHPMAGREQSGVAFADHKVFCGANFIITPTEQNTEEGVSTVAFLAEELGFSRVSVLSPEEHDRMIAFTSQLAHVVSNAYVKSPTAKDHRGFSAGSYKDMTRVAWLNEQMWSELFLDNREPLLYEIDTIIHSLTEYRDAIRDGDGDTLTALLRDGRIAKENIDG
jgi:prephenate dehydrogenase